MKQKKVNELFFAVASAAMNAGMEIVLENRQDEEGGNVLGGSFSANSSTSNAVILRTFWPSKEAGEEDPDDE